MAEDKKVLEEVQKDPGLTELKRSMERMGVDHVYHDVYGDVNVAPEESKEVKKNECSRKNNKKR